MAGREEVSLSPHAVTAPEVPPPGFRLALIAQDNRFITSWVVHPGGASDSLVHGLCTRNAVYSVVNVPKEGKGCPSNSSEGNGDFFALSVRLFQNFGQSFQASMDAVVHPAEVNAFCLGNLLDGHSQIETGIDPLLSLIHISEPTRP